MARFSERVLNLKGSVFSGLADRLASYPGEVYPLHIGDTWLPPAKGARMQDLTVEAIDGLHRYAPPQGLMALRQALAEGVPGGASADQVLISAGATGALSVALGALLRPGDEVLILAPFWPLIRGIVHTWGGVPVAVDVLGLSELDELLSRLTAAHTERTVAVYWNTPNNPTGRVLPQPWIEALCDWAAAHELWVLADEVYEHLQFEGQHVSTRAIAPTRTLSAHSFSKSFGMAGNRCGYLVGPAEVLAQASKIGVHTVYSTPTASQHAALRLLQEGRGQAWSQSAREAYAGLGRAAAARLGLSAPQGSTFLFIDVADQLGADGLIGFLEGCAERGLFVAPGPSFGPYPTHIRVCFSSTTPAGVRAGIEVLASQLGL